MSICEGLIDIYESCSLPKQICSFPSEMTKMPLRDLSHVVGVNPR